MYKKNTEAFKSPYDYAVHPAYSASYSTPRQSVHLENQAIDEATLMERGTSVEKRLHEIKDVESYILDKAEKLNQQAQREGWSFWTVPSTLSAEDFDSAYEYELSLARDQYSDCYKEIHGFRPGFAPHLRGLTLNEVETLISNLYDNSERLAR